MTQKLDRVRAFSCETVVQVFKNIPCSVFETTFDIMERMTGNGMMARSKGILTTENKTDRLSLA